MSWNRQSEFQYWNINRVVQCTWQWDQLLYNVRDNETNYCTMYVTMRPTTVQCTWQWDQLLYNVCDNETNYCTMYVTMSPTNVQEVRPIASSLKVWSCDQIQELLEDQMVNVPHNDMWNVKIIIMVFLKRDNLKRRFYKLSWHHPKKCY